MGVIEALYTSILEPRDHPHINQERMVVRVVQTRRARPFHKSGNRPGGAIGDGC